jgi:hypothetical protein
MLGAANAFPGASKISTAGHVLTAAWQPSDEVSFVLIKKIFHPKLQN